MNKTSLIVIILHLKIVRNNTHHSGRKYLSTKKKQVSTLRFQNASNAASSNTQDTRLVQIFSAFSVFSVYGLVTSFSVAFLLVLLPVNDVTWVRFTRRAVSLANLNIINLYGNLDYRRLKNNIYINVQFDYGTMQF
jgi:hypothetical protein